MALITALIGNREVKIDTEDIDLLVRHCPLAELDASIKADKQVLSETNDNPTREYWQHRLNTHELARDISVWCWNNNIPTIDLTQPRERKQGIYALEKCRELETTLNKIRQDNKGFQEYILDKLTYKKQGSKYT